MKNRICELFGIKYPIIQGGMVWCSGWRLASAVSNSGGLGLIGAGSMSDELLLEHIEKTRNATNKPFGVNLPLLRSNSNAAIDIIISKKVPIVFTSAGDPGIYTEKLKAYGIKVVHVIAAIKYAEKAEKSGVDAIVAEGFEAGGHNGRDESTTFTLIPAIREITSLPLIAAGGIGNGKGMLAAMILGAEGVQIGSAFAISSESSAHQNFKHQVIASKLGDTDLILKKLAPTRLLKNEFHGIVKKMEDEGASMADLRAQLGKGRAKSGIFEGDIENGELEIGQVSALLHKIEPASEILQNIITEYEQLLQDTINSSKFVF